MARLFRIFPILFVLSACVETTTSTPSVSTASEASAAVTQAASLNGFRKGIGRPALSASPRLAAAARAHARDMAANDLFSHTGSNGSSVGDRVRAAGYTYCNVMENIAQGHESSAEVIRAWAESPSHRSNMADRRVTEYGLARADDNNWVLVLARPGPGCR